MGRLANPFTAPKIKTLNFSRLSKSYSNYDVNASHLLYIFAYFVNVFFFFFVFFFVICAIPHLICHGLSCLSVKGFFFFWINMCNFTS